MNTPTPTPRPALKATGMRRRHARCLETELAALTTEREVIQHANAHHAERRDAIARAESAEREAFDWKKIARYETARAERAEREVAGLKANNRFQRGHSAGYAEAKADCEAELATERARLDSGHILLTVAGERAWHSGVDLRAAIDAAMKEGA